MQFNPHRFRAWDTLRKEWICQGYHAIGEVTLFGMIEGYLSEHKEGKASMLERLGDVIETQYIGLHDKNSADIYEGDICKVNLPLGGFWSNVTQEKTGVVEWDNDRCRFVIRWAASKNQHHVDITCDLDFVKIGTIFENPEFFP